MENKFDDLGIILFGLLIMMIIINFIITISLQRHFHHSKDEKAEVNVRVERKSKIKILNVCRLLFPILPLTISK